MKKKTLIIFIVTILICGALLWFVQRLVEPKYMSETPEGAMIAEYYDNCENNDIIFVGDCEVYEYISPITLWENYGITSYIRGSAQQLVWQSYYLVEDTFRHEKPKAVIYNVGSMIHADPDSTDKESGAAGTREAYNRMSIDGMKWSFSKLGAISSSMTTKEKNGDGAWSYIFPILRYHDRWSDLSEEDFKFFFKRDPVTDNGYLMEVAKRPVEGSYTDMPKISYDFGDYAMSYLERLTVLCKANGVELILMKAPSLYPIWHDEYEEQIRAYAEEHDLTYINCFEYEDEIGIDWSNDTYDKGLHLNVYGAEKMGDFLGKYLSEELGFESHKNDTEISDNWLKKADVYYERKAALEAEQNN